jgi:uncharacterized protein DUF4386
MRSAKSVGRIIGALVFLHLATGLMTPYIMLQSLSASPASALAVAAGMETQIRLAVALLFVGGVIPVAIAITAWPMLLPRSPALGQWLLALAVVSLAMQIVENQHFLSLLSLSLEHGRASGDAVAVLAATAPMVRAAWRWAHYTHLLSVVAWMLLFCGVLFRLALVPRALAAAGIVTTMMQLGGITLPVLLGYRVPLSPEAWGVPLGVAYLGLSLWLMASGFAAEPARGEAPDA